ncbi:MAG: phytanoyl-CoA dioxygenase family protein [Planctomycetes bacterium]|nr:phytanoyl-CoA dioxygenase family protein [Planctomycetota bacterium]
MIATDAPASDRDRGICNPNDIQAMARRFLREGYLVIPAVISRDACAMFRGEVDRIFDEVPCTAEDQGYGEWLRVKLFQYSREIASHMDLSPVIDVVEAVLGANCHLISNNVVRNDRRYAISEWHVDEEVLFPLPNGVEHDERVELPCLSLNSQWYLTDVGPDDGPTQVVPYSHRSGRMPPPTDPARQPSYGKHGAVSLLAKAGDVVLQHAQIWHRGAPVLSDRTRYMMQYSYGRRCFSQRFHPFTGYRVPEHVLAAATPRQRRLLGFHERGPWG